MLRGATISWMLRLTDRFPAAASTSMLASAPPEVNGWTAPAMVIVAAAPFGVAVTSVGSK
ncbi:MAG TPA: hypothetical protein VND41_00765 [Nitrososphaerales archaeon]|nr:hypothetical protein [Nitrososphaerales archaeon]